MVNGVSFDTDTIALPTALPPPLHDASVIAMAMIVNKLKNLRFIVEVPFRDVIGNTRKKLRDFIAFLKDLIKAACGNFRRTAAYITC